MNFLNYWTADHYARTHAFLFIAAFSIAIGLFLSWMDRDKQLKWFDVNGFLKSLSADHFAQTKVILVIAALTVAFLSFLSWGIAMEHPAMLRAFTAQENTNRAVMKIDLVSPGKSDILQAVGIARFIARHHGNATIILHVTGRESPSICRRYHIK